jgi:murein DD-endopeptidase MepM/ murein hydrolase activator NlpD
MSKSRRTLVLIRRGEREETRWRVSPRRLAAVAAVVAAAMASVGTVGWFTAASRSGRAELDRLRAENEALRRAATSVEGRLIDLQEKLADSEDRTRKLAVVAGIGDLGPSGEAGIGGPLLGSAGAEAAIAALESRSDLLARELDRVEGRIQQNLSRLTATPAIWPVAGILTSGFGNRLDPLTGQRAHHSGVDISAPPGRPVVAAASGVVVRTEQYGGLGRAVFVSHGFGLTTVYGHLSRILVSPGQRLERGTTVGLVGNTGRATGYHLHYEVQVDGDSVNPLPFLLAESRSGS